MTNELRAIELLKDWKNNIKDFEEYLIEEGVPEEVFDSSEYHELLLTWQETEDYLSDLIKGGH
jgi:hypothetical protein